MARSRALAQQDSLKLSDEDMYKFLSYYDTKNFAPYVTCPVYTVMGLQDPVCPPRTNFAPYINFASTEKSYKVNPFCQHDPGTNWYSEYMAFFKNHLKPTSTGIHNAIVSVRQDDKTYNLAGQRVGSQYKGLVIVNGKKRINK